MNSTRHAAEYSFDYGGEESEITKCILLDREIFSAQRRLLIRHTRVCSYIASRLLTRGKSEKNAAAQQHDYSAVLLLFSQLSQAGGSQGGTCTFIRQNVSFDILF